MCLDRASPSAGPAISGKFHSDDLVVLLRMFAAAIIGLVCDHRPTRLCSHIAARAARHGSDTNASISLPDRRVNSVDDLVLAALLCWNIFHIIRLVAAVNSSGSAFLAVSVVDQHLMLYNVAVAGLVEATMNLDHLLRGGRGVSRRLPDVIVANMMTACQDGIAGALFRPILLLLSAHYWLLGRLDGAMGAASVARGNNSDLLDTVLTAASAHWHRTPSRAVSWLSDCRCAAKADLRGPSDNGTGRYESFRGRLIVTSRMLNILLLDDGGLVAGPSIRLVAADPAARVRPHVLYLSNGAAAARFNVIEDDACLV